VESKLGLRSSLSPRLSYTGLWSNRLRPQKDVRLYVSLTSRSSRHVNIDALSDPSLDLAVLNQTPPRSPCNDGEIWTQITVRLLVQWPAWVKYRWTVYIKYRIWVQAVRHFGVLDSHLTSIRFYLESDGSPLC
jgi:hypothetical protein